jgi:uncharacterized protein involved in cysteine biosynthesis
VNLTVAQLLAYVTDFVNPWLGYLGAALVIILVSNAVAYLVSRNSED